MPRKSVIKCNQISHVAKICGTKRTVEIKCFKCKKSGHIAKNCGDNSLSCSICKKSYHTDKDCYYTEKEKNKEHKKVSFLVGAKSFDSNSWFVDSGSTSHMVNDATLLKNRRGVNSDITLAKKGKSMEANSVGEVNLSEYDLHDVLYVPDLVKNLLSVSAITSKGGEVKFKGKGVTVKKGNKICMRGYKNSAGLYEIKLKEKDHALYTEKKISVEQKT